MQGKTFCARIAPTCSSFCAGLCTCAWLRRRQGEMHHADRPEGLQVRTRQGLHPKGEREHWLECVDLCLDQASAGRCGTRSCCRGESLYWTCCAVSCGTVSMARGSLSNARVSPFPRFDNSMTVAAGRMEHNQGFEVYRRTFREVEGSRGRTGLHLNVESETCAESSMSWLMRCHGPADTKPNDRRIVRSRRLTIATQRAE